MYLKVEVGYPLLKQLKTTFVGVVLLSVKKPHHHVGCDYN
jgi:hypothetical protein